MQRQAIHYFANSNSSRGYVSFYESNFGALERVVPLHGYPLKPLGNLLEDICDCAAEQKRRVEWIHNCLDNTPDCFSGICNFASLYMETQLQATPYQA